MASIYPRQDDTGSSDDPLANFQLWYYNPSIPAAVIYAIVFVGLTSYHAYLLVRRRTWFCIPFVVGGLFEIIGYIARALAHGRTNSVGIYSVQSLMLLLAPILFAASVYMILGRIVRVTEGEQYSIIRVNWLTKIFVCADIFCFLVQGTGGGLLAAANTHDDVSRDNNIVLGGLVLQIVVFILFLVTAAIFHLRMSRRPTSAALEGPLGQRSGVSGGFLGPLTWQRLLIGLYVTSVLITIRNIFRVVEFAMGWRSYLLVNEWAIYIFDGLMMISVLMVCIMWYHPEIAKGNKNYIPGRYAIYAGHNLEQGQGGMFSSRTTVTPKRSNDQVGPWS